MVLGKPCKRNVATMRMCQSVVEAARRMPDHHLGDLVVLEGEDDIPLGVFRDRDLVVEILAQDAEPLSQLEVGDVRTEEAVVARDDVDGSDVLHKMEKKGIRLVPIVNRSGARGGIPTFDGILGLVAVDMLSVARLVNRQRPLERERWT